MDSAGKEKKTFNKAYIGKDIEHIYRTKINYKHHPILNIVK